MKEVWKKLLSKKRFYSRNEIKEDSNEKYHRNSFHKDYDRLIFSNSFRRLSRKTQVHPLSKNDHVHNRLTHSLEVASVGRSLGLGVGKYLKENVDKSIDPHDVGYIVQTACLAHDIGNPPFGHAGEEVIKEWFKKNKDEIFLKEVLENEELNDFINFDGNAQSFRIVSQLEHHPFEGGMRLTFATLGTMIKYPHSSKECKDIGKSKFNFFQSEQEFFKLLFEELGLTREDSTFKRHPLSFLMEASDDICYALIDLQDAVELKIIKVEDIKEIFNYLVGAEETEKTLKCNTTPSQQVARLVAYSINNLTEHTLEVYKNKFEKITTDNKKPLIELFSDQKLKKGINLAKKIANEKIFNEKRKIELELGAYNIIETLLDNFTRAIYQLYKTKDRDKLSFRNKRALELMELDIGKLEISNSLYNMYQRAIDYIVGMTDNYAKYIAHQLKGMGY